MIRTRTVLAILCGLTLFVLPAIVKHAVLLEKDDQLATAFTPVSVSTTEQPPASLLAPQTAKRLPYQSNNEYTFPPCYTGPRKNWRPGKCADDASWLVPWMKARPDESWVVVDVGANKGYVIAQWLEMLLGTRTPFSPHNLGVWIYSNHTVPSNGAWLNWCGGCTECLDPPPSIPESHRARDVKVYAFEPSVANYKWLRSFFTNTTLVNLTNAAVSHTPSMAYFPDGELGKETGKVLMEPKEGYVPVRVVNLDQHLQHETFLHILSTDAEGFDQDVAKGAHRFLSEGRVGVYQFEMYRAEDYKSIFEQLYEWGYVCHYFTEARGKDRSKTSRIRVPSLVRISGCWHDEYQQMVGWVNGLCYNYRVPGLRQIFESLEKRLHSNRGPAKGPARRGIHLFLHKYVYPGLPGKQGGGEEVALGGGNASEPVGGSSEGGQ